MNSESLIFQMVATKFFGPEINFAVDFTESIHIYLSVVQIDTPCGWLQCPHGRVLRMQKLSAPLGGSPGL